MDDDHRWGFEEAEDWEYDAGSSSPPADDAVIDTVAGEDADRVVTVTVNRGADVVSVKLATNWRRLVDPRGLHSSVREAANRATMQALASQVEEAERNPSEQPLPNGTGQGVAASDETPLTREDIQRLTDAVSNELDQFTRRLSAVVDHPARMESAGGHVSGSSQRGQVLEISIDSGWASASRNSEIESELLEVLRALRRAAVPDELARGPQGSAIAELNALASDPQTLLRRIGLIR